MNRQDFTATTSYPLSTQTMALLQESIDAVAELSRIGGANYILSGCEQVGNSVNKGVIVINGEPMPFAGGTALPTITIIETVESVMANGTTYDRARIKRHAQFATGSSASYLPWANFKPLPTNQQLNASKAALTYVNAEIEKLTANSVPKGAIVMWSGSVNGIPQGWALCNGTTVSGVQTPNLKGRFIVGYDPNDNDYNVVSPYESNAKRGGGKTIALSINQMPAHNHISPLTTLDPNRVFNHFGYRTLEEGVEMDRGDWEYPMYQGYTSTTGSGAAFDIRPNYYTLAYIMKVI